MDEREQKKRYIKCFECSRSIELNEDVDEDGKATRLWGLCPICKTDYNVVFKTK